MLTYTPRINSSDGLAMFSTAESLVRRGALDIEQIRWMGLQQGTYGLDGLLYSRKGIGVPIALLPLTWLGLILPWFGPVSISLLFNAIITALTAVLLSAYLQKLGYHWRAGLITGLIFGLCTLAWPYAKSLFSDPFSGFLLLAAAYALLKLGAGEQGGWLDKAAFKHVAPLQSSYLPISLSPSPLLLYSFLAGLLLAWNVATRYAEAIFVPIYGLLLLYYLSRGVKQKTVLLKSWAKFWRPALAFGSPLFLAALGLIAFNLSRYGDPFNTGYLPEETFSGILWEGIAGQLISPGRGLLLYCPIFILSLGGFIPFLRRCRAEGLLALSVILIHLLLYGKWFMWHGGYAWGPRFMIPTLPFWSLFLGPVVAQIWGDWRLEIGDWRFRRFNLLYCLRITFLLFVLLSLAPQLLSVMIDFAPFQNALLETGLPLFDGRTFFELQYSPFIKAWGFIKPEMLDLAWAWEGRINGWLLAALCANVLITGWSLKRSGGAREQGSRGAGEQGNEVEGWEDGEIEKGEASKSVAKEPDAVLLRTDHQLSIVNYQLSTINYQLSITIFLSCLSTLIAVTLLLTHSHTLPPGPLRKAVAALNEAVKLVDAVVTNDPGMAMPFAELYKSGAPVLGLNSGGLPLPEDVSRRLQQTVSGHRQVWWVPNWLPPEESGIEQTLLAEGFRARNQDFESQRLVLFAYPDNLSINSSLNGAEFNGSIHLIKIAYASQVTGGGAFPVELHWQTTTMLAENYYVFVHLLDAQGQLVAQSDGQPAQWRRPTSTWQLGETIVDRHGLWIPAEAGEGDYQLWVGLYQPEDGRRLYLPTGADAVKLELPAS